MRFLISALLVFCSTISLSSQDKKETKEWKLNPKIDADQEIFKVIPKMPIFQGCMNTKQKKRENCTERKLKAYVDKKTTFTKDDDGRIIKTKVILQFVIGIDGETSDIHIISPINNCDRCNEEIMTVFNEMPTWQPGIHNGRPVNLLYTYLLDMGS